MIKVTGWLEAAILESLYTYLKDEIKVTRGPVWLDSTCRILHTTPNAIVKRAKAIPLDTGPHSMLQGILSLLAASDKCELIALSAVCEAFLVAHYQGIDFTTPSVKTKLDAATVARITHHFFEHCKHSRYVPLDMAVALQSISKALMPPESPFATPVRLAHVPEIASRSTLLSLLAEDHRQLQFRLQASFSMP